MPNLKATPGPWKASIVWDSQDGVEYLRCVWVEGPKGPMGNWDWVCIEPDTDDSDAEKQIIADANLISAAPDLYAALQLIVETLCYNDEDGLMISAQEALAKARGEVRK